MNVVPPKVKAKAIADIYAGKTIAEVAKKNKVAESTVKRWLGELKKAKSGTEPGIERKVNVFFEKLEAFAVATMDMLTAQAELLADHEYLRKQDTNDIIQHSRFIHERLVKHIELDRALHAASPELPERTEAITPEIVEDVP